MISLNFAVESFWPAYREAKPLLELHYNEIAKNKQLMIMNPDEAVYKQLDGKLLLVCARDNKKLVGYFLWIMTTALHYKHVKTAEEDLHYLLPDYRLGMNGYLFIKEACKLAKEHGAQLLIMREKIGHSHPAIMQRLGFAPTDLVYTKVV